MDRVETIRQLLNEALAPVYLDIVDESHLHVGHPGAAGGGGHFRVTIVSEKFNEQSSLARHRMVYMVVDKLMQREIHALSITALTPDEHTSAKA